MNVETVNPVFYPNESDNDYNRKEVVLGVHLPPFSSTLDLVSHQIGSTSGVLCRICHEDEVQEELISPCLCAGSLGLAHASCIERWLSSSNTHSCEICHFQYSITKKPKSFIKWIVSRKCHYGPTGFCGDVLILLLLTPLCVGSVYLCALGALSYVKSGFWEGTGLVLLCSFLLAVYVLWCIVAVRFHWKRFRRWQSVNQTVRLKFKYCSKPDPSEKNTQQAVNTTVNI